MHRFSDIAKLANLYSDSTEDEQQEAAIFIENNPEVDQTAANFSSFFFKGKKGSGKEAMQRTRNSKTLAATTKDLRAIAREAHKRGLNRQMTPAQFKLLDPNGTHILSPQMYHDKADGKPVEEHIRVYAHIKLIGKHKAIGKQLDVPSKFLTAYITAEEAYELREYSKAIRSIGAVESVVGNDDTSAEGNA